MKKKELMRWIKDCDDDAEIAVIADYGKVQITDIDTSEPNEIIINCEAMEMIIE